MNLSELLSKIRLRVKEFTDDSLFEDHFLASEFFDQRATFLVQRLKKHHFVSDVNYTTFCIDLESDLSHLCGCKKIGCEVFRSKDTIPTFLSGRNKTTVEVYSLGYDRIDVIPERDANLNDLHPIKSNRPYASIVNGYLILWNRTYPSVLVKMIADNPLEVMEKQSCKEDSPCVNVYDESVYTDREIIELAVDKVIEDIRISMGITSDMNNDTNPEIKT